MCCKDLILHNCGNWLNSLGEGCEVDQTRTHWNLSGQNTVSVDWNALPFPKISMSPISMMWTICGNTNALPPGPAVEQVEGGSRRSVISVGLAAAYAEWLSQRVSHRTCELQQSPCPVPNFRGYRASCCCSSSTFQTSRTLSLWLTRTCNMQGMEF